MPTQGYKELVANVIGVLGGDEVNPAALGYNSAVRDAGWDWPSRSLTMIGRKRLRNFRTCIESVLDDGVCGDIVEAGVWRGGASILARAVLAAHGVEDRKVFLADSFAGLPAPDPARYPADEASKLHLFNELAVSRAEVERNFGQFDLLDSQVAFVEGWFRDTMPNFPAQRVAVLRLDGDMYESTIDPLRHLWDRIPPGGWVIVDDYHVVPSSRQATHDFLDDRRIAVQVNEIDGSGVFFQKIGDTDTQLTAT